MTWKCSCAFKASRWGLKIQPRKERPYQLGRRLSDMATGRPSLHCHHNQTRTRATRSQVLTSDNVTRPYATAQLTSAPKTNSVTTQKKKKRSQMCMIKVTVRQCVLRNANKENWNDTVSHEHYNNCYVRLLLGTVMSPSLYRSALPYEEN
jgi:hypothetical protein